MNYQWLTTIHPQVRAALAVLLPMTTQIVMQLEIKIATLYREDGRQVTLAILDGPIHISRNWKFVI